MRRIDKRRGARAAVFLPTVCAAGLLGSCGGSDFQDKPRPPVPLQITGVITAGRVTISPDKFGAGPVVITVSNQTQSSHTITLTGPDCSAPGGESVEERVGPVNPLDTATLQKTLKPGHCIVKAGSEEAVTREIQPASITIGPARASARNKLLLP